MVEVSWTPIFEKDACRGEGGGDQPPPRLAFRRLWWGFRVGCGIHAEALLFRQVVAYEVLQRQGVHLNGVTQTTPVQLTNILEATTDVKHVGASIRQGGGRTPDHVGPQIVPSVADGINRTSTFRVILRPELILRSQHGAEKKEKTLCERMKRSLRGHAWDRIDAPADPPTEERLHRSSTTGGMNLSGSWWRVSAPGTQGVRPLVRVLPSAELHPRSIPAERYRKPRAHASRWPWIGYILLAFLLCLVLYVACEVIMKVLAMRTVHTLAQDLPEYPQPMAPTKAGTYAAPLPAIATPPSMPPRPQVVANRAPSLSSLRSFVLPVSAVCG